MRSAVSERLGDLIAVAQQLQGILDAEKPDRLLPGMVLARVAAKFKNTVFCAFQST